MIRLYLVATSKGDVAMLKSQRVQRVMSSSAYFKQGAPPFKHVIFDSGAFTEYGLTKARHPWLTHLDGCDCKNVDFHVMLDKIGDQGVTCDRYQQHLNDGHKCAFVYYANAKLTPRVRLLMNQSLKKAGASCFAGTTMRYMQRMGMSWPFVLKRMEEYFRAKNEGGLTHLLGSFNIKALTEMPFTSADTATWARAASFGSFIVFHRSEDGIHLKQLPIRGGVRDQRGDAKKWKGVRDKAYTAAKAIGWDLNAGPDRLKWNIRVYKILERTLNTKRKGLDSDILDEILDVNALDVYKDAHGGHVHPHQNEGKHDHAGLPPDSGPHIHGTADLSLTSGLERLASVVGAHQHQEGDPIEGVHIGAEGASGAHTHPVALKQPVELPLDLLAELHELRPWLQDFDHAEIRERASPQSPWGTPRRWDRLSGLIHSMHPQHQPKSSWTLHSELFKDGAPNQLIQKIYVFKDGKRRPPTDEDWQKESEWLGEFAAKLKEDPLIEFLGDLWDGNPVGTGEYEIRDLGDNKFSLRYKIGDRIREFVYFGNPLDARVEATSINVPADDADSKPEPKGNVIEEGTVRLMSDQHDKTSLQLIGSKEGLVTRVIARRTVGDWYVVVAGNVTDRVDKAFHIRGQHWLPYRFGTSCPTTHPNKLLSPGGMNRCYTNPAAASLRTSRKGSKDKAMFMRGEHWVPVPEGGTCPMSHPNKLDTLGDEMRCFTDSAAEALRASGGNVSAEEEARDAAGAATNKIDTFKVFAPIVHHEEDEIVNKAGKKERRRLIYGVVYEPFTVDAQNDWANDIDIEAAAHQYLLDSRNMKLMHRFNTDKVRPVESYIAPTDFQLGNKLVKKGSWVLVSKVFDDAIWAKVESGEFAGYSLGGRSSVREGAPPRA